MLIRTMSGRIQPTSFGYTLANLGTTMYTAHSRNGIHMYQDAMVRRLVLGILAQYHIPTSHILVHKAGTVVGIGIVYSKGVGGVQMKAVIRRIKIVLSEV